MSIAQVQSSKLLLQSINVMNFELIRLHCTKSDQGISVSKIAFSRLASAKMGFRSQVWQGLWDF
ncbi:MAG: hypothetical protein KME16_09690 [Scytolyngbya sp. HA4215-MV1]|jgi:hypothetical protein|nr:hypothetical protein [Scytolyngbya sp. HA4215-MV1]